MKLIRRAVLILVLLASVIGVYLLIHSTSRRSEVSVAPARESALVNTNVTTSISTNSHSGASTNTAPLIGEKILLGYANTNLPPENDLTLLAHLMDNFTLLVKSASDRPLSANEDWAAMFRGLNPAHERFLPDHHIALNARGQLVDRWKNPLFFHALGGRKFEIRSAGPDGKLWTEDDIHRNPDGSFRRGSQLNPPSLLNIDLTPIK